MSAFVRACLYIKVHEIVKDAKGDIVKMRGEYNAQGDPKTTDKKLTWLADVVSSQSVGILLIYYFSWCVVIII